MKRAKRKPPQALALAVKPRNPFVAAALLKPGGAHRRKDKRAARALLKRQSQREPVE